MIKKILAGNFLFFLVLLLWGGPGAFAGAENPVVKLETSEGNILISLDAAAAPKTVENFIQYVRDGFYDNTIFHRVIKHFMIQGGGLTVDMKKKTTRPPIANEADNRLSNTTGTIAMARTQDPHSATAQFFINTNNNANLNYSGKTGQGWGYCVFGKVVEGMDVVKKIENMPTRTKAGRRDVPVSQITIKKAVMVQP